MESVAAADSGSLAPAQVDYSSIAIFSAAPDCGFAAAIASLPLCWISGSVLLTVGTARGAAEFEVGYDQGSPS